MLRKFFGLFMVMSMDAGLGMISARVVGLVLECPVDGWEFAVAAAIALSPDFDLLAKKLMGRQTDSTHRRGISLHYPQLTVPISTILAWSIEPFWGWVTLTGLLAHFLHDSVGECNEWGVRWNWPRTERSYLLFPRGLQGPFLAIYEPGEVGNHDLWDWVERWYLRPTWESVTGAAVLAAALVIVLTT